MCLEWSQGCLRTRKNKIMPAGEGPWAARMLYIVALLAISWCLLKAWLGVFLNQDLLEMSPKQCGIGRLQHSGLVS